MAPPGINPLPYPAALPRPAGASCRQRTPCLRLQWRRCGPTRCTRRAPAPAEQPPPAMPRPAGACRRRRRRRRRRAAARRAAGGAGPLGEADLGVGTHTNGRLQRPAAEGAAAVAPPERRTAACRHFWWLPPLRSHSQCSHTPAPGLCLLQRCKAPEGGAGGASSSHSSSNSSSLTRSNSRPAHSAQGALPIRGRSDAHPQSLWQGRRRQGQRQRRSRSFWGPQRRGCRPRRWRRWQGPAAGGIARPGTATGAGSGAGGRGRRCGHGGRGAAASQEAEAGAVSEHDRWGAACFVGAGSPGCPDLHPTCPARTRWLSMLPTGKRLAIKCLRTDRPQDRRSAAGSFTPAFPRPLVALCRLGHQSDGRCGPKCADAAPSRRA